MKRKMGAASEGRTLVRLGGGLPVVRTDDGQADLTLLIDVRVVDLGTERDLGRLEWVLRREVDLYPKRTPVVWHILLRGRKRTVKLPFLRDYRLSDSASASTRCAKLIEVTRVFGSGQFKAWQS